MPKRPFQRKDRFYFKAKKEGYPARSAYKIAELDDRFHIFKPGNIVIDLGCAPGGWLKLGEERMTRDEGRPLRSDEGRGKRCKIIGIDILPLGYTPGPGVHFIQGDFTKPENQSLIKEMISNQRPTTNDQRPEIADWVISDMSPNISGVSFGDQYRSFELCRQALQFALEVLKPGGNFLCKTFPGSETDALRKDMKENFKKIETVVPEATRRSSTEIYLIALNRVPRPESRDQCQSRAPKP